MKYGSRWKLIFLQIFTSKRFVRFVIQYTYISKLCVTRHLHAQNIFFSYHEKYRFITLEFYCIISKMREMRRFWSCKEKSYSEFNRKTHVTTHFSCAGWMPPPPPPPHEVFLTFFLEDKTSAPDVFSSCSFIPCAHFKFETSLVMVSCYGYEIWRHK